MMLAIAVELPTDVDTSAAGELARVLDSLDGVTSTRVINPRSTTLQNVQLLIGIGADATALAAGLHVLVEKVAETLRRRNVPAAKIKLPSGAELTVEKA